MASKTYSYIGKGQIYLRARDGQSGLVPVGNCSALSFSVETNAITQPDYTQPGGGNANEVQRVSSVGLSMTMLELAPGNLEIALRGTASEIAGSAVSDERHSAYVGALIAFNNIPDIADTDTITVSIDPDGTPTTATEGADYEVTRAGIRILEGGAIADGDALGIDYTSAKADVIEAMTGSAEEYELVFDGLNEADSGKAVLVRVHRVKWSPTSGLGLIGDEFAELPLEGSVLVDNAITGAGVSRYFKVAMAQ